MTALLVFFAPNQYELIYNWSSLPFCLGFLFAGLGFHFFRKGEKIPGTLLYMSSFFTVESFFVLGLLLEISVFLPFSFERNKMKALGGRLLLLALPYAAARFILQVIHPYDYGIGFNNILGQIKGLVVQCGLINFFKMNSILSLLQIGLVAIVARAAFRMMSSEEKKDVRYSFLWLSAVILVASSYYYVMNYSAGRALAGQVAFCWGLYLWLVNRWISGGRKQVSGKICILLLAVSVQIAAAFLIYRTKSFNYGQIQGEIVAVKEKLRLAPGPVNIDPTGIRSRFKRDWIFASDEDVELMFQYYLTHAEYSRLHFGD